MTRRTNRGLMFALALLLLVVPACGGSDSESSGDATATDTTATAAESATTESDETDTSKPETAINEADQALAEASILQLSDFPTGWRATKSQDDDDDASALEECWDADFEGVTVTGRAESDNFESGPASTTSSVAAVYSDPAAAQRVYSQFTDGTLVECIAEYMREQPASDGVKVTKVETGRLSFPMVGEESDARQVEIQLEAEGLTPSGYADLVAIRDGRVFTLLFFVDVLTPFSPDQEIELAQKVASRMSGSVEAGSGETSSSPATSAAAPRPSLATLGGTPTYGGAPGRVAVVAIGQYDGNILPVIVKNNTRRTVSDVKLSATASTASGKLLVTGQDQGVGPDQVPPGGLAMGYVYFDGKELPPTTKYRITTVDSSPQLSGGDVAIKTLRYVKGSVVGMGVNKTKERIEGPISVYASCLNAEKQIVKLERAYADRDAIPPGTAAPFTVDFTQFGTQPPECQYILVSMVGYTF